MDQNYWIETLVFADYTVRQRFGTLEQAQLYVITLMSLVSEIFKVPSLQISGLRDQRILRFCVLFFASQQAYDTDATSTKIS